MDGTQGDQGDDGAAIGVGHKSLVAAQGVGIDLRNHQGYPVIHAEVIAVIDDDASALDRFPSQGHGCALGALGSSEKGKIHAFEGFRTGGTNIVRAVSTASDRYDADVVTNNEIGLKMTLMDGRLVWNISAYQMTWDDMQLVAADPTIDFGWGQITVNAGEAEINGVESNFAFAATDRLKFDGSVSFTDSEVTEGASIGDDVVISKGEELPLSPDLKASFGAEYNFPAGNNDGYMRFDYSYVDEQTNATQGSTLLTSSTLLRGTITTMPSYSLMNFKIGMGTDDWDVSLAINNIADKRAVTYVPTRWTDGRQYVVRPREFTLTYRKNW